MGFLCKPALMMRGATVAAGGSTWDPTNKNANITLSDSNTRATTTGATTPYSLVRGAKSPTVPSYLEIVLDTLFSGQVGVVEAGLQGDGANLSNDAYDSPGSVFFVAYDGGTEYYHYRTKQTPNKPTLTPGSVIGIAYNPSGGTAAFYLNGSIQVSMSGVNASLKPMWGADNQGASAILRTTAAQFTQPIPSGFSPWG